MEDAEQESFPREKDVNASFSVVDDFSYSLNNGFPLRNHNNVRFRFREAETGVFLHIREAQVGQSKKTSIAKNGICTMIKSHILDLS